MVVRLLLIIPSAGIAPWEIALFPLKQLVQSLLVLRKLPALHLNYVLKQHLNSLIGMHLYMVMFPRF